MQTGCKSKKKYIYILNINKLNIKIFSFRFFLTITTLSWTKLMGKILPEQRLLMGSHCQIHMKTLCEFVLEIAKDLCVLLIKSVHMVEGDEFGRGKKGGG